MSKQDTIIAIAERVRGCTFASISTETEVDLAKKHPFHGMVRKRTVGSNVMLFSNKKSNGYENMVKRRLDYLGIDPDNFKLKPRKWGVRRPDCPLVDYKGEVYLEVIIIGLGDVRYFVGEMQLSEDEIDLPKKYRAEQGGLPDDKEVVIRTYKLDSITRMLIFGEQHDF